MNILITGGTGFFGSHIAGALSTHHAVTVLDLAASRTPFRFIECDLRDAVKLSEVFPDGVELVIHAAAKVEIKHVGADAASLMESNVAATENLVKVMAGKGSGKLIYISSMTVYGPENASPVGEGSILGPLHAYGLSKKGGEDVVRRYAASDAVKALVLRFPGLYGYPRKGGFMFNAARKLLKGEALTVDTKGLKYWETINVDDAAWMIGEIVSRWKWEAPCETINCSYGEEIDLVKTAFLIRGMLSSPSRIEVKEPLDYKRFYLDNAKLKGLIGRCPDFKRSLAGYLEEHSGWIKQ